MTMLTLTLDPELLAALEQLAQTADRTVQDVVVDAILAYVFPPTMALDLFELGNAMLKAIQEAQEHPPVEIHVTEAQLEELRSFNLPEDRARLSLGETLWAALVDGPADGPLTEEAAARQASVIAVTDLLRGTLTEAGIRQWWMRPRSSLHGRTPAELLTPGWTPDGPEFRAVLTLAEDDAGFTAP